ncbi:nuclear transport factor 2 family protein [Streptomyces sp. NPDC006314]|uniref:nuclear transport factor 2 family protein n=1 Tax=Streptomyces sp. NPDC006314 TaxID=3154475 RepID=UPI0033A303EE
MSSLRAETPTTNPERTVRDYYRQVDAGNVRELVHLFAPDARYLRPGYEPIVGHDGLERFYTEERVIESGLHSLDQLIASGRNVAVHGQFRGRLKNGRDASLRFADFFTLTDGGLIAGRQTFFDSPLV